MRYARKSRILALCLSAATLLHPSFASASISQFLIHNNTQTIQLSRDGGQAFFDCLVRRISQKCNATTTDQGPSPEFQKETYWSVVNKPSYFNSYLSAYLLPNSTENPLDDPFYACSSSVAQAAVNEGNKCFSYGFIAPLVVSVVLVSTFVAGSLLICLGRTPANIVDPEASPSSSPETTTASDPIELSPNTESGA